MREVAVTELGSDLPHYLRLAQHEEILITRDGKPAGVLVGFESEDDWLDYQLERDPRFLERIDRARPDLRAGRGVPLEEVQD
jgi:prevent-host-death family protein